MKIHLLLRQPLNPRAVVQNYEKIPGQRGMEIELKATVHIMGAVWYRPVYIKELTPHSFFVQYVFYIIQNKFADTCSRFLEAFLHWESLQLHMRYYHLEQHKENHNC